MPISYLTGRGLAITTGVAVNDVYISHETPTSLSPNQLLLSWILKLPEQLQSHLTQGEV